MLLEHIFKTSYGHKLSLQNLLSSWNLPDWTFTAIDFSIRALITLLLAFLVYFVTKKVLLYYAIKLIKHTRSKLDDHLIHRRVFQRISQLAPGLVIYGLNDNLFSAYPVTQSGIHNLSVVYMIFVLFWTIQALFLVLEDIYNAKPFAMERPIRSYIQLLNLLSYFVGGLIVVSFLFDVQVTRIFAGLGAMAAVLMLVFRDTILGFVAGIQLSANKMMQVGDWISMPSHDADGTVLEVTLNTVKVQNWDRTITTIPTYALVTSPFTNWRGMQESGGRRIKRSINVDMCSVMFCTPEMLAKYRKIHHLKDYIENRQKEIEHYNKAHGIDESVKVNGRRLTNLGVFRKYLENYCKQHPKLNTDMTFLIRHLQPSDKGVPIEVYVFSSEKAWAVYEDIQADIFDHILAVLPEFDLRVFQQPSGNDVQAAANGLHTVFERPTNAALSK